MYRTSLFLFLFLTALCSCNKLETVENKDESGRLLEQYSRRKDTFAKEGKYLAYHANGKVLEEAHFKNDSLDGERKFYFESGKLESVEYHSNGAFTGKYQKYFENGQLSNEGEYLHNEMSGVWKRWYESGELREEVSFSQNQENGPFKEYHKNGKVMTEGAYLNGDNEHGELKKYDENGNLTEKMHCEYGVCMTKWTKAAGEVPIDSIRMQELVAKLKLLDAGSGTNH